VKTRSDGQMQSIAGPGGVPAEARQRQRYVPEEAIRTRVPDVEVLAGSDWPMILRQVASQPEVASPGGEFLGLARA